MSDGEALLMKEAPLTENGMDHSTAHGVVGQTISKASSLGKEKAHPTVLGFYNENVPPNGNTNHTANMMQGFHSAILNFNSLAVYQTRRPVEAWKYKEVRYYQFLFYIKVV